MNIEEVLYQEDPITMADNMIKYCDEGVNFQEFFITLSNSPAHIQTLWHNLALLWVLKCKKDYEMKDVDLNLILPADYGNKLYNVLKKEIDALASNNQFDGRNHESKVLTSVDNSSFEVKFIKHMSHSARLIQKKFSSLIFFHLETYYGKSVTSVCGKDFWVLDAF